MTAEARPLFMLTPALSGADGISRVSATSADALCGRDRLTIWSLHDPPDTRRPDGSGELRAAGGSRLRLAAWGLAAAARRSCKRSLVLAMHLHLAPVALPLVARGARLAVFLHGIEAWAPLSRVRVLALRAADTLIANSHYTAARFRESHPGLAARPIQVCHLGVSSQGGPDGPPGEEGSALIVGRLVEGYKGHDELLEAWPALRRAHPAAKLVVAGDGPDRERLERKARALGLVDEVRFVGRVTDHVLGALYRDCAFLVMPSLGEGFGLVFLEAMRAGKPCVGGPGAAEEVVAPGQTGLIVDPRRPGALLDSLRVLFGDPALRVRMGLAGRARWQERFTADLFSDRLRAALDPG